MGINAERIKTFQEVGVMSDKKEPKELQEKLNRELNEEIDMKKFGRSIQKLSLKGLKKIERSELSLFKKLWRVSRVKNT